MRSSQRLPDRAYWNLARFLSCHRLSPRSVPASPEVCFSVSCFSDPPDCGAPSARSAPARLTTIHTHTNTNPLTPIAGSSSLRLDVRDGQRDRSGNLGRLQSSGPVASPDSWRLFRNDNGISGLQCRVQWIAAPPSRTIVLRRDHGSIRTDDEDRTPCPQPGSILPPDSDTSSRFCPAGS